MSPKHKHLYEFEGFRLTVDRPGLWLNSVRLSIPPKALEVLILLVEKNGEIVSRDELLETVWKETFVEESNINYTISLIRKILGRADFISTVPKQGYRFSAPVKQVFETSAEMEFETRFEGAATTASQPDPGITRNQRDPSRRNLSVVVIAGAVLIAAVIGGFFIFGRNVTHNATNAEISFKRLTDTGDVAYMVVSPTGEYVAFTREQDLYLRDQKSQSDLKLNIENQGKLGCLQFSPDGKFIYFGSYLENASGKISLVPRFGGPPKLVAEDVWSGFSISPDGKVLAFNRKFPSKNRTLLVLKNLETGSERTLAERWLPEQYYWNNYPGWSPDGTKIAAVVDSYTEHFIRLIVIDVRTGAEEEIKTNAFRNMEQVIWSSDQRSLIASANAGDSFQLWRIPYPGGETKRITNDLSSYLGISITKDGRQLLARQRIYYSNIWVAEQENLDAMTQLTIGTSHNDGLKGLSWLDAQKVVFTSNTEKLRDWNLWVVDSSNRTRSELTTDSNIQNDNPVTSPTGEIVYFTSNRSGSVHIWRINSAGEKLEQVTQTDPETELYPQIANDGLAMYFLRKKENNTWICKRSLVDGTEETLASAETYAAENFLSLSSDGKYLAFQLLNEKGSIRERSGEIKVGILQTDNPKSMDVYKLPVASEFFTWKSGEQAFDYVIHTPDGARIMRQSLNHNVAPVVVVKIPKDDLFGFAWSKNGRRLAVARGQLLRDVVLLDNFPSG